MWMSPVVAPALTLVWTFISVFPFYENRCWLQPSIWTMPLVAPALTFVLTFMVVIPFLEKLMSAAPLITDSRRFGLSSLDAGLNLQSPRHGLVVLELHITTFNATLNLQTNRLIVVKSNPASFHICFDFHRSLLLL